MSVLCDTDLIAENQVHQLITPFELDQLQPASYDLRLNQLSTIDGEKLELPHVLGPLEFVLGSTVETLHVPLHLAAKFEGKSSLGRSGVMTHVSAGFVDPGFTGELTLEIFNVSTVGFVLTEGMRIGQIMYQELLTPAYKSYSEVGHYNNQKGPTLAIHQSFYKNAK